MSIKQRQIYTLVEKVLKEYYQNGYIPAVEEVASKINKILAGNPPGLPITKYRPAFSRKKSIPEDWNKTIDEIATDLELLYSENLEQINKILVDFDYYEVERRKLERQIAESENRIEQLLLLNDNADGYLYSVYDDFKTLNKIDMDNTSAWVDFNFSEVCLPYSKIGNTKIEINSPVGELITTDNIISSNNLQGAGFENIVDDSLNTYWLHEVVSVVPQEVVYKLTFTLEGEPSTRLVIDPHVTGTTTFIARYTEDGHNWMNFGTSHSQEKIVYDFYDANFVGIEIIIKKRDYEETISVNGQNGFVYRFGLKNVSLYKIGFEKMANFQSKPLSIINRQGKPVTFDKISLEVIEEIPVDCSINYYLALRPKSELLNPDWTPDWQPIVPVSRYGSSENKVIDLKSISSFQPSNIMSPSNNVYKNQAINGLRFYEMGNIPTGRDLMSESFTMYKGINQFKQSKYKAYWPEYGPYPDPAEVSEPGVSNWVDIKLPKDPRIKDRPVVTTNYLDIGTSIFFHNEDEYSFSRFETNLYFKNAVESTILKLRTTAPSSKLNIAVYVNGEKIELTKNKINTYIVDSFGIEGTLSFNQGWNNIIIYVYKGDNLSTNLNLNINFLTYGSPTFVRAEMEPMIFVPLFDYLYNVYEKETDKYSISEDNKLIVGEYQKNQNAKYLFSYRYRIDQGYSNQVYLRAELKRGENTSLSPKLKFYKLRVI